MFCVLRRNYKKMTGTVPYKDFQGLLFTINYVKRIPDPVRHVPIDNWLTRPSFEIWFYFKPKKGQQECPPMRLYLPVISQMNVKNVNLFEHLFSSCIKEIGDDIAKNMFLPHLRFSVVLPFLVKAF